MYLSPLSIGSQAPACPVLSPALVPHTHRTPELLLASESWTSKDRAPPETLLTGTVASRVESGSPQDDQGPAGPPGPPGAQTPALHQRPPQTGPGIWLVSWQHGEPPAHGTQCCTPRTLWGLRVTPHWQEMPTPRLALRSGLTGSGGGGSQAPHVRTLCGALALVTLPCSGRDSSAVAAGPWIKAELGR